MTAPLPLTFARRELRGGLKGFRILVACLALGVAAIAAAGSLRAAFQTALDEDSRALLGGDLDIRQSYAPIDAGQRAALDGLGTVSAGIEMRAMARSEAGDSRRLVELKGVDGAYPLVGRLQLEPAGDVRAALERRDGVWGAVADPNLLAGLDLALGSRVRVGEAVFEIRATIAKEPDRVATALSFGPRLMVAAAAVPETALIQPGALLRWTWRVALSPGLTAAEARRQLAERFPEAGWQVRDTSDAAPGIGRFLDNLAAFLTLVGLTALLVGGIGVANAVKAYLDGRIETIAILKSLGAPARTILATYAVLVAALAGLGTLIGLGVGALVPWAVVRLAGESLPLAARVGIYPVPLAVAAAFGLVTALVFTLWPLARARAVPATALFRQVVVPPRGRIDRPALAALALAGALLAGLAILSSPRPGLAAGFVAASVATLALFRGLAWVLSRLAARAGARRTGLLARPTLRLALANLHRPGSAVVSVVLSLGLGLTVLVAVALVEANLARQFGERLPAQAPSFFFIDIQPDQLERFDAIVGATAPTATVERAPMIRGRIMRIAGVPVAERPVAPEAEWAVRSDRGLTMAAEPPPGTRLTAGEWWPQDYAGPPLASVDANIAKGFGLKLGDTLGISVLGREVTVKVASFREIEWSSLNMNFTFILSPGALAGAPHTWIATVHAPAAEEAAVERAVTDALPNVSAIRVKEALESVRAMIANADLAVRLAAAVTLAAGALVLAGAVMAGHARRVRDAVILKVLGATSGDLWKAWAAEFGIVGIITGIGAGLVGTLAAWAVLVKVMRADWAFLPDIAAATATVATLAALLAGFAGTWTAMRAKAASYLRSE
ncbi:ABC transporter permease [Magnetospirillum sp. UT-4]|uniref:ABC transporter permease n=1 Tax=Magnetospirillum sp. UT-4 TaxID=2681467 RepID=UPI00137FBDD8|nr:FtsX-like permease family protein [Magnetospirillum sp. UT-4]CAA7624417.1 putative ABC transporter, permease protein [Magnetospirillum sp. UT-4]